MNTIPKNSHPPLKLPPWVVLHVPHDSTSIPLEVRSQFLLSDTQLSQEVLRLTDHFTLDLFTHHLSNPVVVRAPVSRLVVDVERFVDDEQEPMAERGMGVLYQSTSSLTPLRGELSLTERTELIKTWYWPHHRALETAVSEALRHYNRCLVLDCHSFASVQLPYEVADPSLGRPDICIGTDSYHTSPTMSQAFFQSFRAKGWSVALDHPFAGALVPLRYYQKDPRVSALMVEINRGLYMDEVSGQKNQDFDQVSRQICECCLKGCNLPLVH